MSRFVWLMHQKKNYLYFKSAPNIIETYTMNNAICHSDEAGTNI